MSLKSLSTAVLVCLAALASAACGQVVVSNTYTNLDVVASPRANVPVTFSRIGADGDFTKGITPVVRGRKLPAQVNVLRRATDGSIRHALVSFVLPSLAGGGKVKIDWLNEKPATPPPFVKTERLAKGDIDLNLLLTTSEGKVLTSHVGPVVRGSVPIGGAKVVYDGPVMKEYEIWSAPKDEAGKADPQIDVIWRLRFFTGSHSVRISAIVESCKERVEGLKYPSKWPRVRNFKGVKLISGGKTLYEEGAYRQIDQTRYRVVVWTDGQLEDFERRPDYKYWVKGKFVPLYRWTSKAKGQYANMTAAKVDATFTEQAHGRMPRKRKQGILEHGVIFNRMPAGASRWDIAPYPAWTVAYLLSGGPLTYKRILHADGNGAGAFYIHTRQGRMPGHNVFTVKVKPSQGGYRVSRWDLKPTPQWQPDHAHAPSLGYISYLITGDKFYAEEMSFWAAHHAGEYPYKGLNWGQMARAFAWSLRQITDAAFILPEGDPLQKYFDRCIVKCMTEMTNRLVKSKRRVHSPIFSIFQSSGRLDWINAKRCSTWMYSWVVWSLANTADKGYPQAAAVRDWAAEYIVGFYASDDKFTAPDGKTYHFDANDAMSYSMAVELWEHEIFTDDKGIKRTKLIRKIKDLDNYGEIWYWTKVNSDNMFGNTKGLKTAPNADGVWPLDPKGWGHGMFNWGQGQKRWWAWHRYGAWMGLVVALENDLPNAREAWKTMTKLAGYSSYGYEMVPRTNAQD